MLQVTLFTMAGPAIMLFYVYRFKSDIGFFVKKSGIFILGHIAQPYVGPHSPSCSLVRSVLKHGSEMIWQKSSSSMFSRVVCMSVW